MKTLKTSNIILILFGIAIVILLITQVVKSTYHPNNDSENAIYTELKIDNIQSFKYLVLNGYRDVTYEVMAGKQFKIEAFTDPRNTDSCKTNFSNDTLYISIVNKEGYSRIANIPDVKICIPPEVINILTNGVHADFTGFQNDTLTIKTIDDNIIFSSGYRSFSQEFMNIGLKNCNIKTLNYSGTKSELFVDKSNTIAELNFKSRGKNSKLNLNDVIIGNLNLNQDSAEVVLSGKAINYYLKK
jgi:hypothetical protein